EEGFQLSDNKQGRQKLKELIRGWQQEGLEELYCGVESTGGYENNWYAYLKANFKDSAVYVCRINPKGVKSIGEASLKRTITDAVSAENIAAYMIGFPDKLDYGIYREAANIAFKEGRQHATCIRMHQKQKVQLSNQLEKLLYQYFGEVLVYCRHGMPVWLLSMLVKYPTAAMTIKAGAGKLAVFKGVSRAKADAIISKAKNNIQDVSPQIAHMIQVTAREILHKEELIKDEKEYLATLHADTEEVVLLQTIPGLGLSSAVTVVLEIEDISRFETVKKLAAFFGVHPTFKQSGDEIWGNHMSKKGRGEIRAVLYMASLSAIRYNPILKQVYAKARAKGMKHYPAMGVVMHKFLRIIYGILTNKTVFNPETDELNQKRSTEKQQEKELQDKTENKIIKQKKHRFQEVSTD
ncbi:IS110 family RNA-guided transposase, partial [Mucilaginibacter psychrotolerans]